MKVNTIVDGRYLVIRQIGSGGSSNVYLVRHIKLDSTFAMKVVNKSHIDGVDCATEAHVLKKLRHPQLPRVIDIFELDGVVCIVRDYIEGSDLERYIDARGPQSLEKTIDYSMQIIDLLSYLHGVEQPLIYRDLKPSNLIRSAEDKLFLIDFGTTRNYNPERDEDTVYLGTNGYAPPELFGGHQSDSRTDIYSLGATIYYIYCAEHWVDVPTDEKFAKFHGSGGEALKSVIEKAMQLSPQNRYQSVTEMRGDIVAKGLYDAVCFEQPTEYGDDKVIVSVMGLSRGCGCTHQAIALADYCARNFGKTVYIERSLSQNLNLLENFVLDRAPDYHSGNARFKLSGVHFVKAPSDDEINALITQRRTNIVIDYGNRLHLLNDFLKGHKKIFILPKSPWALVEYHTIKEITRYQDVEFVVNLSDREDAEDIARWLSVDKKRIAAVGYLADPFQSKQYSAVYGKLTGRRSKKSILDFLRGER